MAGTVVATIFQALTVCHPYLTMQIFHYILTTVCAINLSSQVTCPRSHVSK